MVKDHYLGCQSGHRGRAGVPQNFIFSRNSVPFRASELALPRNSECLGMGTFFRGITETVPSLFRGINEIPFPTLTVVSVSTVAELAFMLLMSVMLLSPLLFTRLLPVF